MKKLFLALIMVGFWTISSGFSSVAIGSITYPTGKVVEMVTYNYTQETADAFGKTITELETDLAELQDVIVTSLKGLICGEIEANQDLSEAQKEDIEKKHIGIGNHVNNGEFSIYVSFSSQTVWNLLCGDVLDSVVKKTETELFTTTTYNIMNLRLAKYPFNSERAYMFDIISAKLEAGLVLKGYSPIALSEAMPGTFNYSYATTSKRLHSNANQPMSVDSRNSIYYHTWTFTSTDDATIKIWQTRPNVVAWYVLALVLTALFAIVFSIIAYKNEKSYQKVERQVFDLLGAHGFFGEDYDYDKIIEEEKRMESGKGSEEYEKLKKEIEEKYKHLIDDNNNDNDKKPN